MKTLSQIVEQYKRSIFKKDGSDFNLRTIKAIAAKAGLKNATVKSIDSFCIYINHEPFNFEMETTDEQAVKEVYNFCLNMK